MATGSSATVVSLRSVIVLLGTFSHLTKWDHLLILTDTSIQHSGDRSLGKHRVFVHLSLKQTVCKLRRGGAQLSGCADVTDVHERGGSVAG